jgi:hypothetical protein
MEEQVMSNGLNSLSRLPEVDTKNLRERKLLEAELLTLDKQIRNFGQLRDRFSAVGGDANAYYRKVQARRLQILKELKGNEPHSRPVGIAVPRIPISRREPSWLAPSTAPHTIVRPPWIFGGTSGYVQMAPASEGINVVPPQGQYPISGQLETVPGYYPGNVGFTGGLSVGPDVGTADVDPTINYFWLHNWTYLIPFPAPAVTSLFTYRFYVYAIDDIFFDGVDAMAMSFVSVGETATLSTGNNVVANIDAGWPLMQDLLQPAPLYNGHYGQIDGAVTVQRSFMVPDGHVPGVAIVVGAVGALSASARVSFGFGGQPSGIAIGSDYGFGHVAYSYEPEIVAHP